MALLLSRTLGFALVVVLFVACGTSTPEPTPTPTPTSTPVPTPTRTPSPTPASPPTSTPNPTAPAVSIATLPPGVPSAAEVLKAALAAMAQAGSYHFEMDARISGPTADAASAIPLSFVGDFQAPDRARGKVALTMGLFSVEMETITIGDTTYATNPQTGEWQLASGLTSALPGPTDFTGEAVPGLVDVALLGVETVGGTPAYRLRGALPVEIMGGTEGKARADYWIGVEDSLILQIDAEGELGLDTVGDNAGAAGISGTANISMTIRFSRYGEPVLIEAPEVAPPQATPPSP